ncbi:MAG: non-hydrolyzing UDP-N-acetylglucosamine 2-epimerase [Solirubrobacterales bacterium]
MNGSTPAAAPHLEDEPTRIEARLIVPCVVGTRPEAIKMLPVVLALHASEIFQPVVVSTGQHHQMVEEIFGEAGLSIDVDLWAGAERAALNERVSTVMQRFNDFCLERFGPRPSELEEFEHAVLTGRYPATVLVHGDTSSAMAAALAAFHMQIPVMHVEAGLRTGGTIQSPFPEEANRQVITCVAAMHFAPTFANLENLVRENVPIGQVFVTGNTGIDALRWAAGLNAPYVDPKVQEAHDADRRVVVVTAHRRENWGAGLQSISKGIARLATDHDDVQFIVPLHPNPRVRQELGEPLEDFENVLLTEPLDYTSFARLLERADLVITDSGGIQEEAPSLGKPVLVARDSTERGEGVDAGTLILVGTDPDKIAGEADRLLSDPVAYAEMASAENPYGDGFAADRIVAALEHLLHTGPAPVPFGAGYDRNSVARAAGVELPDRTPEIVIAHVEHFERDAHHPHEREAWPL